MPSLRIPFPEGDKVILLRGSHISVGRFPDNTIQLEDRSVSAYHFELLFERDHYRLHDLGSTNGVMINGRRVEDFHLREEMEIHVGAVICGFHPGNPMTARPESMELLPVREEVQSTRRECRQLKEQNAVLREQVQRMLAAHDGSLTYAFDQLAEVNAKLQLEVATQREEIESLASRLTLLVRDREHLQRSYNELKAAYAAAARPEIPSTRGYAPVSPGVVRLAGPSGDVTDRPTVPLKRGPERPATGDNQTEKLVP